MNFAVAAIEDVTFASSRGCSKFEPLWEAVQQMVDGQCVIVSIPPDTEIKTFQTAIHGFLKRKAGKSSFSFSVRSTADKRLAIMRTPKKK